MERFETDFAYPSFSRGYDPAYRERLLEEAARLQGDAVRRGLVALGRGIRAVFRGAFRVLTMVAEGSAAVRLYEDLSRLDDAALADLGITREGIGRYVVDSMDRALGPERAVPAVAALSAVGDTRREYPAEAREEPRRRAA